MSLHTHVPFGAPIVRQALRRTESDPRSVADADFDQETTAEFSDRALLCAGCRHRISSERERIRVDGRHDHHCTNPAGYRFHLGCFRDAPGCVAWGAPTSEHSWFAGYAWRYALCGGCSAHLGWRFEGVDSGFFGLIIVRLAVDDAQG